MRRMRKKLRSTRGLTLTEVLATALILALVAAAIGVGVNTALRVYRESVTLSDAQTLSSTLSQALMDELRYARDIQADGSYTSGVYGPGSKIGSTDGRVTVKNQPLVGEGAYGNGQFSAGALVQYTDGAFQVTLTISEQAQEIQKVEFSVCPIN